MSSFSKDPFSTETRRAVCVQRKRFPREKGSATRLVRRSKSRDHRHFRTDRVYSDAGVIRAGLRSKLGQREVTVTSCKLGIVWKRARSSGEIWWLVLRSSGIFFPPRLFSRQFFKGLWTLEFELLSQSCP